MELQHERVSEKSFMPPWVRHEHSARYAFAAGYVGGKTVVDCACGDGLGSEAFLKAGARSVEAFDLSVDAVAAAKKRSSAANFHCSVAATDCLPLPGAFADVYVSLETIEHVRDDKALLAEAARVLKPDGIFLCSTPNRAVTNPGTSLVDKPWNRFHVREYSHGEFAGLLGSYFGRVQWYGQNPNSGWKVRALASLAKILPRHCAVKLNQAMKLPWLLCDRAARHEVVPLEPGREHEYLLALCREPRKT